VHMDTHGTQDSSGPIVPLVAMGVYTNY
jgi:hypothetical protein